MALKELAFSDSEETVFLASSISFSISDSEEVDSDTLFSASVF